MLRRHSRLADGFEARCVDSHRPGPFDLWIHSASAGEAYLVSSLLEHLRDLPARIIATTNTRQGHQILSRIDPGPRGDPSPATVAVDFFPFDRPHLMETVCRRWRPRLMVILETELWPGLLYSLRRFRIPSVVVNGRMTAASLKAYRLWPWLWTQLAPYRILAITDADGDRFRRLFPQTPVTTMNNIKFDRIRTGASTDSTGEAPLRGLRIPAPFIVMGSVRTEEETPVAMAAARLLTHRREAVIGIFPRHMNRLPAWEKRLSRMGIRWQRRSARHEVPSGTVVLWDVFGELRQAYSLSQGAFVGGSLAPLGGQNFLEPLACGIIPVIGPSWHHFAWAAPVLFDSRLVRSARDWQGVSEALLHLSSHPPDRQWVRDRFRDCIRPYQGGSRLAAGVVRDLWRRQSPPKAPEGSTAV
jgi:3-deoxy-D-manno-octulosonic-acid transferase